MNQTAPQFNNVSLADVAQCALVKAVKLQAALARMLARQHDTTISAAALEELGIADYFREFGHRVTARTIRALFKRTIARARAAGAQSFERLEFYLPEKPARKVAPKPVISLQAESEFRALHDSIAAFANPAEPSLAEKNYLWLCAFELYEEKLADGRAPKKVKRALLKFLERNAPFLVAPDCISVANSLRVNFHNKYSKWSASDRDAKALDDARSERSGFFRKPELTEHDFGILVSTGAKFGGGAEQAWTLRFSELSADIRNYYRHSTSCPLAIREKIGPAIELEKNSLHGPHAMRTAGAFVGVEPDGTAPGDWDQSDDMTMVNVWWEEAPDSPSGFWFGQGQLLPWIDERSWFVYTSCLISDPYYDAFSIRNSWNKKAKDWGLPRRGLSLERGIWKTAKLVVGEKHPDLELEGVARREKTTVPAMDTATGLRRLGLRFAHATHARGKIIEPIFAKVQNYFQAAPGYVGRNPLTDRYEDVQKQILLVKSGKNHPKDFFLHKQQWRQILDKVFLIHNRTPMHGKYHKGLSPEQVFKSKFTSQLVKIPDQYSFLYADYKDVRPVSGNGITFKFGKQTFRYKCYELAKLRGQRVLAWFNSAAPETICCTDMNGKNPFIAEREQPVFRHDPLAGTLEKAQRQNAEMNRYQKELHSSLKGYYTDDFFTKMFRPCLVDAEAVETSQEFSRVRQAHESTQAENARIETKGRKVASKLGMALPADKLRRPGTGKALDRLQELLESDDATATKETL